MLKKDKTKDCPPCKMTSIGGQALLEGIMMRGPKRTAMAVRNTAGEIVLEESDTLNPKRAKFFKLPFIRGFFNFIDSMKIGYKCLMRSAEISGLEEAEAELAKEKEAKKKAKEAKKAGVTPDETVTEPEKAENEAVETEKTAEPTEETITDDGNTAEDTVAKDGNKESVMENTEKTDKAEKADKPEKKGGSATTTAIMIVSTLLGIGLAVLLFIYLPTWVSSLILGKNAAAEHSVWLAVISGGIKVLILIAYMALVSLMKDIRRTFMYHGAEHKTIFCYEHGNELTVENVRKERRFHPRCGTSFLFFMVIVGVIVMIPIGILLKNCLPSSILANRLLYTLIRTGIAIVLIPLMTGIGYEIIKLAGRKVNLFTKIMSAPGLWMQRITTREPDDSMIECAITAMKAVIPDDDSDKLN